MTRPRLLLACLALVAVTFAAFVFWSFSGCAMTEEVARQMVMAELSRAGLDPQFLGAPSLSAEGCYVSFEYEGNGREIDYVAAEDLLHGPELHSWDYAEDPNGP